MGINIVIGIITVAGMVGNLYVFSQVSCKEVSFKTRFRGFYYLVSVGKVLPILFLNTIN